MRSPAIAARDTNDSCSQRVFGRSSTIVRSRLIRIPTLTASITRPRRRRSAASTASAARRCGSGSSSSHSSTGMPGAHTWARLAPNARSQRGQVHTAG
jgi:hypothetical protein